MATDPLLQPLPAAEWDDELTPILGAGGQPLNIFGTLAHHPKLMKRWLVFGNHVLAKSTLPARDRELADPAHRLAVPRTVRVGAARRHRARGRGHRRRDHRASREGPDAAGWDAFDALLLRAADELHDDSCVAEATYRAIAERYDEQQMLDLVFTVGQYHLVSMALNTFRVERDDGVTGMPIPDR